MFAPGNVLDHNPATAWRCDAPATGQRLTFTFDAPTHFTSVGLIGGYVKVDPLTGVDRFPQNHRVRQVRWTFSDGTSVTQDLADSRTCRRSRSMSRRPRATMEILATYPPGGRSAARHGADRRGPVHRRVARRFSAVLAVVGDLLEDIVVRIAATPALGTDTPARIERRRGGSAANIAAWAATSRSAQFASSAASATTSSGSAWSLSCSDAGVDVRVQRRGHTGSVVVLVGPDGERTMLPDRAAATELADVDAAVARWGVVAARAVVLVAERADRHRRHDD